MKLRKLFFNFLNFKHKEAYKLFFYLTISIKQIDYLIFYILGMNIIIVYKK